MTLLSFSHARVLEDVLEGRALGLHAARLALRTAAGAAVYGFVLGLWRAPLLSAYVTVKLPLVLLVTAALTMLFNWVSAVLLGLPLRLAQVCVLTLLALAVASTLLSALAPVALLFTLAAPSPGLEARGTHNVLFLVHTAFIGGSGLTGTVFLRTLLSRVSGSPARARRVYALWVTSFALVGGEVSWVLRPFVGSIYFPVVFLRPDALEGNLYEFVLRDILPYLAKGHT